MAVVVREQGRGVQEGVEEEVMHKECHTYSPTITRLVLPDQEVEGESGSLKAADNLFSWRGAIRITSRRRKSRISALKICSLYRLNCMGLRDEAGNNDVACLGGEVGERDGRLSAPEFV